MNDLKHLHNILLMMMDELDKVCEENNIKYTIIGGTMLGAVRHGGFIPWDDDVDIAMTRDNFDMLMSCSGKISSNFFIQNNFSDSNYYYGFAKLLLKDTSCIEYGHENTEYKKGIFIDIFPLDNTPNSKIKRFKQKVVDQLLKKILRQTMKISSDPSWSVLKKIIFGFISLIGKVTQPKSVYQKLEKNMRLSNCESSDYLTSLCGSYGYDRETLPADLFCEYEKIKFEDRYYMSIKNRDIYLTNVYGDYMELPPIDKRHAHKFFKLDFGKY